MQGVGDPHMGFRSKSLPMQCNAIQCAHRSVGEPPSKLSQHRIIADGSEGDQLQRKVNAQHTDWQR